jgi:hypothetical protein
MNITAIHQDRFVALAVAIIVHSIAELRDGQVRITVLQTRFGTNPLAIARPGLVGHDTGGPKRQGNGL